MSDQFNSPANAPKEVPLGDAPNEVPLGSGCGSANCACKSQAMAHAANPFFDDTDYGTPARHSDVDVTLEIDGQTITVPAATSVMRAAAEAGVNVPKLCATD